METFTLYSKPDCPFCDQAKALLESKGLAYEVIHLDVGQQRSADEAYISRDDLLKLIPTARSMPQVLKQSETSALYIGGFQELKKHLHT
jgi:glutaredoxin